MATGFAPAKINLALHITGQRPDGYHMLDSLVVFAGVGDQITVAPSEGLSLTVSGPFAPGVPTDESNLILRAAKLMQGRAGGQPGAAIHLQKNLPHPAGIGGGSSDAAAAMRGLADLWQMPLPEPGAPEVLGLGADVPVCVAAPVPMRMSGIGERLTPLPELPEACMILVNPQVDVPTGTVFAALARRDNPALPDMPAGLSFAEFTEFLAQTRNDMAAPAAAIAPEIDGALALLRAQRNVAFAGMSGSGATCFGLTERWDTAATAAEAIRAAQPGWWVQPARILRA